MGDLVAAVRSTLAGAGDAERARAQQAYMRSAMPYRGIASPELRRLLRPLLTDAGSAPAGRGEWESAVRTLWDGAEFREERMLKAEEKAARLPAMLTVPMILFILPPLFVVLLGPAILRTIDALSNF